MRQKDIKLGGTYAVRVSGVLVAVRIEGILGTRPGSAIQWVGTNLHTGRIIRLTARRAKRCLDAGPSPSPRTQRLAAAVQGRVPADSLRPKGDDTEVSY